MDAASGARWSTGLRWPWSERTTRRPSRSATACGGTASSPGLCLAGGWNSLRAILESPDDQLDHQSQLHRQDLLVRYPAYADLRREAHALHDKLAALPLVSEDKEAFQRQKQMLEKLGRLSQQEEILLREMAVRREPAAMIFPPLRTTADIQARCPTDTPC